MQDIQGVIQGMSFGKLDAFKAEVNGGIAKRQENPDPIMLTKEKFIEMGFIILSDRKVQDRYGKIYYPRKAGTPLKAIKLQCQECMGMDRKEKNPVKPYADIRNCTDPMCPLFDFRMGKNPFMQRRLTKEQREAAVKRFKIANK